MAGLYGAAAHSAGWAWFGGGSLASGGGGMALGHFVLPGVGTAVALATLSVQLHRQANDLEKKIELGEDWLAHNLPVLDSLMNVEGRYRRGSAKLRNELLAFHEVVARADKKLRPLGRLNDWHRRWRVKCGGTFYVEKDMRWIEELIAADARFLENLPDISNGV